MDALDPAKWRNAHVGQAGSLCVALLLMLFISRACSVLPIALAHNLLSTAQKLNSRDIIIIWWSGLMRGAVSVALAYYYFDYGAGMTAHEAGSGDDGPALSSQQHRATLIVATLVVVLITVLGLGNLTNTLTQLLVEEPERGLWELLWRGAWGCGHRLAHLPALLCGLAQRVRKDGEGAFRGVVKVGGGGVGDAERGRLLGVGDSTGSNGAAPPGSSVARKEEEGERAEADEMELGTLEAAKLRLVRNVRRGRGVSKLSVRSSDSEGEGGDSEAGVVVGLVGSNKEWLRGGGAVRLRSAGGSMGLNGAGGVLEGEGEACTFAKEAVQGQGIAGAEEGLGDAARDAAAMEEGPASACHHLGTSRSCGTAISLDGGGLSKPCRLQGSPSTGSHVHSSPVAQDRPASSPPHLSTLSTPVSAPPPAALSCPTPSSDSTAFGSPVSPRAQEKM
ncbi:hypothetical protein DUNSADRAFT_11510 [Dunaliella salina]|uniref:Cation/H+ exchanger transmembrane domain-containing protein n=1 Tax=Dunaliella salina TaxID=3046 RepID=A0ABQ7H4F1_DUNSA|nr:hypothetical protein DUNSADRAFT_11510 [Dunaliella salina]|eukprot:KAF5841730.1 hypothetical protein DUNSADRAFT_11510 [Dunaliella salina]